MQQARALPPNGAIKPATHILYLTNISPRVTDATLLMFMREYGPFQECLYPTAPDGTGRGMAQFVYRDKEAVNRAAHAMNGVWIFGQRVSASTSFDSYIRREEKPVTTVNEELTDAKKPLNGKHTSGTNGASTSSKGTNGASSETPSVKNDT